MVGKYIIYLHGSIRILSDATCFHWIFVESVRATLGTGPRGELEHLGFGEASAGWAQALRERSKSTKKPRRFFGPFQNGGGEKYGEIPSKIE